MAGDTLPKGGRSLTDLSAYRAFLARKKPTDSNTGIVVDQADMNPALKPHVLAGVQWALRGGRRAFFWNFGMQKTSGQLEFMRLLEQACAALAAAGKPHLRGIVLPLGVRREFFAEASARFIEGKFKVRLKFVQRTEDLEGPDVIYLMNYEAVREGNIDMARFGALSLDEAAVLRSFGSKTFGEFLFGATMVAATYKLVATATPDPNEYLELIAYAHFLGVMDMGESKTRFFKRNSEKADQLTLNPLKEEEFWLWVSTWAMFLQKPSDIGFSDEGYDLPPLDVRWHELRSDHHAPGEEKGGQGRMFKNAAIGVTDAAREKRDSLGARVAKLLELRAEEPDQHRLIWHDLEAERTAIERAIPGVATVYGTQDLDDREKIVGDFAEGRVAELGAKPVMLGAGGNLQRHCARAVFLGIGHKFADFLQAIHRLRRYGQRHQVRIDLIYTEAERPVRQNLEAKWQRHETQSARMAEIIRQYGLSNGAIEQALTRGMGVARQEEKGELWTLVNNDSVEEMRNLPDASVGMFLTSIPFSTQYEYSPNYSDFGHTDDEAHFFRQMDFLTPELVRSLKPGRILAVHCKNRVVPGAINGIRFQTISRFVDRVADHYERHGLWFMGEKIISTDVIRENDQTYRLGYGNVCKDSTRIGCGLPEYLLLFRKAPTNPAEGWADERVLKSKDKYSLGKWQYDAHAFQRSSGDRLLFGDDLLSLKRHQVWKLFKKYSLDTVYDFERDVKLAERLDAAGALPHDHALVLPHSWHPDIWTDVMRARTLNGDQRARGVAKHLCPLQIDVVDRAIEIYSNPGDLIADPFSGIGTVPLRAVKLGRRGWGCELNAGYWKDSVWYVKREERGLAQPTLAGLEEVTEEEVAA